jgi:hypothetical protein
MGYVSSDTEKTDLVSPDNITANSPRIFTTSVHLSLMLRSYL